MSHPFHHHQPWRQFKNTIFEWNWNESDSPLLNLDKEKTILEHLRNKTDLNGVNENIESIYMHLISKMSNRRKWNRRNSRSTSNSFNDRNDFEKTTNINIFGGRVEHAMNWTAQCVWLHIVSQFLQHYFLKSFKAFPDTTTQNATVEIHLNETSVGEIPFLTPVTESIPTSTGTSLNDSSIINETSSETETSEIAVTITPNLANATAVNSTNSSDTAVLDKILDATGTNLTDLLDLNLTEIISGLSLNETLETTTLEPTTTTTTTTTTTIYRDCEEHPEEEHPCSFQKRGGGAVVADCSIKQLKQIPCDVGNVTRLILGNNYIKEGFHTICNSSSITGLRDCDVSIT